MTVAEITEILRVSLWPLTFLVVFISMRRPLLTLLERLKYFEMTGVKVDLSGELDEIRSKAELANIPIEFSARGNIERRPNNPRTRSDNSRGGANAENDKTNWIFDDENREERSANSSQTISPAPFIGTAEKTAWTFDDKLNGSLSALDSPGLFLASIYEHTQEAIEEVAQLLSGEVLSRSASTALLVEKGVLNREMETLLEKFRMARNKAVHSVEMKLTPAEAAEWSAIASGLQISVRERAKPSMPQSKQMKKTE